MEDDDLAMLHGEALAVTLRLALLIWCLNQLETPRSGAACYCQLAVLAASEREAAR